MLRHLGLCALLCIQAAMVFSQYQVRGRISDEKKGPVAYANIGIVNTNVGTISNEDGTFSLDIPSNLVQEKLTFFALGYRTDSYPVASMTMQFNEITLQESPTVLEEITVTPKSEKTIVAELGSRVRTDGTQFYDSTSAGAAMAIKVRSDAQPTYYPELVPPLYIKEVRLWIHQNYLHNFKVRVRLFDIDPATGLPGHDLLHESVIISSFIKKGWVSANLEKYAIAVNGTQFFLGFEWIMDDKARGEIAKGFSDYKRLNPDKVKSDTLEADGEQFNFLRWQGLNVGVWFGSTMANSIYLNNTECYYRNNSLAKWERSPSIMAARVEVSNKPTKRMEYKNPD